MNLDLKRIKQFQDRTGPTSNKQNVLRKSRSNDIQYTVEDLKNAPALDKLSILDGVFENMISQCSEFTEFIGDFGELVATLIISGKLDFSDADIIAEFATFTPMDPFQYTKNFFIALSELCDRAKPTYFKISNGVTRLQYFTFTVVDLGTNIGYNLMLNTGEVLGMCSDMVLEFNNVLFQTVTKAITTAVNGLQAIRDVNTLFSSGKIPTVSDIASALGNRAQSIANDIKDIFSSISNVLSKVSASSQVIINNYLNIVIDWFANLYTTLKNSVTEDALGISFTDPTWKLAYSISIPWGQIISITGTLVGAIVTIAYPVVGWVISTVSNVIPGIIDLFNQKVEDTTKCGISNVNFDAFGYNCPFHQTVVDENDPLTGEAFTWFKSILDSRYVNYAKLCTNGLIHYFWFSNSTHKQIKIETYADMTFNPVLAVWFSIYEDALKSSIGKQILSNKLEALFGHDFDPTSIVGQDGKCSRYDMADYQAESLRTEEWLSSDTIEKIDLLGQFLWSNVEHPDINLQDFDPSVQGREIQGHYYSFACVNRTLEYRQVASFFSKYYQKFVVTADQLIALHEIYDEYDGVVSDDYDEQVRKDWCLTTLLPAMFYNWNGMLDTHPTMNPLLSIHDNDTVHSRPDVFNNSLHSWMSERQVFNNGLPIYSSGWVQFTVDSHHNKDYDSIVAEGLSIIDAFFSNIIIFQFDTRDCRGSISNIRLSPAGLYFIARSALDEEGSILTDYLDFRNSHKLDTTPGSSQVYVTNQLNYYPIINMFNIEIPDTNVIGDFLNIVTYTPHNDGDNFVVPGPQWSMHAGVHPYRNAWWGRISGCIGKTWTNIHELHAYQELSESYFYGWDFLCDVSYGCFNPIPLSQEEASIEHSGYISFLLCGKGDQYYTLPRMSIKAWVKLAVMLGIVAAGVATAAITAAVLKRKLNRAAQKSSLQTDIIGFSDDLTSTDKNVRDAAFKKYRRSALKTSILNKLCGSSIEAEASEQSVYIDQGEFSNINRKLDYITKLLNDSVND